MDASKEAESPKERIERLIREGKITREAVGPAEKLWEERLQYGVIIPNGERITIRLDDLYHVIVDHRIWRKPQRIEQMLLGIFEIRTGREGRRIALSRWGEQVDVSLYGSIVLESDSGIRSLHVVDDKRIRREMKKGVLLWNR